MDDFMVGPQCEESEEEVSYFAVMEMAIEQWGDRDEE